METIAVFVNDAAHARHVLEPLLEGGRPTRWIVVACAPRLTRHIGRWVSNAARTQWRERWASELYAELEPELAADGSRVEKMLARRPLVEVSARLQAREAGVRLLDARAPRWGPPDEPITVAQPAEQSRWVAPLAVTTGLSAMLALVD